MPLKFLVEREIATWVLLLGIRTWAHLQRIMLYMGAVFGNETDL